jgi:hypothetical protein
MRRRELGVEWMVWSQATTTTTRCRFDDRVVPATRTATGRVRCATPPVGHAGSASLAVSLDGGDTYLLAPASFTFLFPQPQATARQAAAVAAMGAVKPKPGFHRKLLTSDDWWPARFGQFYGFYANPEPPEHTSLCIAASTPVVGPEAGGTVVTLKLAGDLPVNHQVFYCKFDEQVAPSVPLSPDAAQSHSAREQSALSRCEGFSARGSSCEADGRWQQRSL